jgi:hypothetical protein
LTEGDDLHPGRVPNAEGAEAAPLKFTGYLLSETHTVGRAKARFFRGFGYNDENWEELRAAMLAQLPSVEGRYRRSSGHGGDLYVAEMRIEAPGGTIDVQTVWEVHPKTGTTFVTAYPL